VFTGSASSPNLEPRPLELLLCTESKVFSQLSWKLETVNNVDYTSMSPAVSG